MSTRHAEDNAPLSQERYRSSPEYADLRGLSGGAVAAKADLQTDARARSLIFFLQALSLRPGGLQKQVVEPLLAMFPDRIGTPSMHKFGVKPGTTYNADQVRAVRREVDYRSSGDSVRELLEADSHYKGAFPLRGEFELAYISLGREGWHSDREREEARTRREAENERRKTEARKHPDSYSAAAFVDACRTRLAEELELFLVELCINPAVRMDAHLAHVRDVIGALLKFKARHEQVARDGFVQTVVSRRLFHTLNRALRARKLAIACGVEGVGKSENSKAWCEQHLGEARYVLLQGTENQTTFFGKVWTACGLGSPVNRKLNELKARVEVFLRHSGMMLVIDEAHRLFPQTERIYSHPESMNWIYTLWDLRLPVALIVTPQFQSRMDAVEKQTDWRSGQFKRRNTIATSLPSRLPDADLRAIAERKWPQFTAVMRDALVNFASPARWQFDAMTRAVEAAEFIAEEAGRKQITGRDLLTGIQEAQATDLALTTPLDRERQTGMGAVRPRRGRRGVAATLPRPHGGIPAEPPPAAAADTDFADHESAPPSANRLAPLRGTQPVSAVA